MPNRVPWTERKFNFDFPADIFPELIERVRGTPARVEEIVRADGVDYIACCSIHSADGPVQPGVYLQELDWVE